MKVTLLGTGAPLHPKRAMTGMIVAARGCQPLLVDTCGGLELSRQLERAGFDRAKLRNVIVTHRHLDHAGGMLDLFLARMPLDIYALPDTHEGIAAIMAGAFPEWDLEPTIARHEVLPGTSGEIGGFSVSFFAAEHRVPTVAVRIKKGRKVFAFSADTIVCDEVVAAAQAADLFLCDALCAEADGPQAVARARATMHATAKEAALMAKAAGARALALTHLARFAAPRKVLAEAKAYFPGPVSLAADGKIYAL
jgi:ribonuclease BN (tRNA processing enzyme)